MYKTPREILRFIEAVLSKLIPVTNYLMLDIKYRIISYFGKVPDLKWEGKMYIISTINSVNIIVKYFISLLPLYYIIYVYAIMWNIIRIIADLTDAEIRIKKMYCDDILSTLDILGSGDSIKKGNMMREMSFFYIY